MVSTGAQRQLDNWSTLTLICCSTFSRLLVRSNFALAGASKVERRQNLGPPKQANSARTNAAPLGRPAQLLDQQTFVTTSIDPCHQSWLLGRTARPTRFLVGRLNPLDCTSSLGHWARACSVYVD